MTRISKARCSGCDCLNQAVPQSESDKEVVCCNDYGFCQYVATFECERFARDGEKLTDPCLVFRKDCLKGCHYSSRWRIDEVGDDVPILRMTKCIRSDARKDCGQNDGVADAGCHADRLG